LSRVRRWDKADYVVGIVTRSDLLKPRARFIDEEHRRERFIGRRSARRGTGLATSS